MATIDKIYVNKKQFEILQRWYDDTKELREQAGINLPFNQYNLDLDSWTTEQKEMPIWNLSVENDMWLLSNCPFDFVINEIKGNYNLNGG